MFSPRCCATLTKRGHPQCPLTAYYTVGTHLFCGRHSSAHKEIRRPLPKRIRAPFDLESQIEHSRTPTLLGSVVLQRFFFRRAVVQQPDRLIVFPNNRHANRKDGIGMATLSPMQLGPVHHLQPGFPPALSLENFWQGSKRFAHETEEEFSAAKRSAFLDPIPHRHKAKGLKPLYWSWVSPVTGEEHRLGVVEAQQFYCRFYQLLVEPLEEYQRLAAMALEHRLTLCGHDALPISPPTKEGILAAYRDTSASFGHERVLFAMLVLRLNPAGYPWNSEWVAY